MKLCQCGCGGEVSKPQNKYILGHAARGKKRTSKQKENYRASFTLERRQALSDRYTNNNPMHKKSVADKFRGDKNPAKRIEVRKKISKNNSMHDPKTIQKIKSSKGWIDNNKLSKERWLTNNPSKNKKILEARINTYTKRLASGDYTITNNWKTGWFIKKDGTKEWFDSSLEEKRMELYESINCVWTKKHKIRIPYVNNDGLNTYYVPDFLVDSTFVDETKGWIKPIDRLKAKHAIEYCKHHNLIYRFYLGTELILELSSDQAASTDGK